MIELDHTIVPARDRVAAARWFSQVFGLPYEGEWGHFAPVKVNGTLTLDFTTSRRFEPHHLAFKVSEDVFDAVFSRLQTEGIPYGSGPRSLSDGKINHRGGGRGVYFRDPDGHVLELLTAGG